MSANNNYEEEKLILLNDKRRKYLKIDKNNVLVKYIDPNGNMGAFKTTQKNVDDFKRYQRKMRKIMNGMTEQQRKLLKDTNSNLLDLATSKTEKFQSDQAIRSHITRMRKTNKQFRNTKSGTKSEKLFNFAMKEYKKNKLQNIYEIFDLDLRELTDEEQQAKKQLEQYFKNTPMDEILKQVEDSDHAMVQMIWKNSDIPPIDEDELSFKGFVSLMTTPKTTKKKARSRINQKKR